MAFVDVLAHGFGNALGELGEVEVALGAIRGDALRACDVVKPLVNISGDVPVTPELFDAIGHDPLKVGHLLKLSVGQHASNRVVGNLRELALGVQKILFRAHVLISILCVFDGGVDGLE